MPTDDVNRGFRFEPITADDDRLLLRPRLTTLLARRFDHRVTTVIAPAGSGKSTALALAIGNNRLDPIGQDTWLALHTGDNEPTHLLAGIAQALGDDVRAGDLDIERRIYDAVWSRAPLDVAIHLDDAHLITSAQSLAAIANLIQGLPRNGHLVIAARTTIDIQLARLRSHGQLLEVSEDDLALTDDELTDLRTRRGSGESNLDLPRHIATADLQLVVGSGAGIDFLWEEILTDIEPDRLMYLRRAALLEELDDETARELTDGLYNALDLVAGMPLAEHHGSKVIRIHQLLRDALTAGLDRSEQRKGLEMAAGVEVRRQRYADGARLYHAAGHDIAARETAREFVLVPTLNQTMEEVASLRQIVSEIEPGSALEMTLEASARFGGLEEHVTPQFLAMADTARHEKDDLLEALALHRILQAAFMGLAPISDDHIQRLEQLAHTSPFAAGATAHLQSQLAQRQGDIDGALAALHDYHNFGPTVEVALKAQRLCDLGRPEQVGVGLSPDDLDNLAAGSEIFVAYAMWLRGEADPTFAESVVSEMVPKVLRRGVTHPSASILGVGTSIALAAGDVGSARRRADQARELCELGVGTSIEQFAHVAAASVAAVVDGDDAAAELLDPARTGMRLSDHPQRAHLLALPLIYATRPDSRATLDTASLGPALTTAVDAGRALVELRESGSTAAATRLPWTRQNLLRVHLLPPHLTELACAAADAGNETARELLMTLPHLSRNLTRVDAVSSAPARGYARQVLSQIPREPPAALSARLLGSARLTRDTKEVRDEDWDRRARVRELCALLLERRTIERVEVLQALWPEHADENRAQASLRTALSTLQRILEPDRGKETEPFFLRAEGGLLVMDAAMTTDVDRFDELMTVAIADDRAGLPASALATYRQAVDLYDGDYVEGLDSSWLVLPRIRLRALALNGFCRMAELTSAQGEPELAARWAMRARLLEPLDQRAARLFISALDAGRNPSGAAEAAEELRSVLSASAIAPDRETTRLLERYPK